MLTFKNLHVYQRAIQFYSFTLEITAKAPRGHASVFDQLKRAAMSIPLNIGEGVGRTGPADAAKSYAIARGSAMECSAVLDVLRLSKVIDAKEHERGEQLLTEVVAMLTKMCR